MVQVCMFKQCKILPVLLRQTYYGLRLNKPWPCPSAESKTATLMLFWSHFSGFCFIAPAVKNETSPKCRIPVRLQQNLLKVFCQYFAALIQPPPPDTHTYSHTTLCSRKAPSQHDCALIQLYCGDFVFLKGIMHYALNNLSCQHISIKPSARVKPFLNRRPWRRSDKETDNLQRLSVSLWLYIQNVMKAAETTEAGVIIA